MLGHSTHENKVEASTDLNAQLNAVEEARRVQEAKKAAETIKELETKEAPAFLKLVANGDQEKAEALLKTTPGLALCYGEVKDCGGRTFRRITAFQYAVWALDWHMWKMLLKYLPHEQAGQQFRELEEKETEHGKVFSLDTLIKALQMYLNNFQKWGINEREEHWCKEVGGLQLLLPAHVIQEYCRPDRSFGPTPSFVEDQRPKYVERLGWNRCEQRKCGTDMAWQRGLLSKPVPSTGEGVELIQGHITWTFANHDCLALTAMSKFRIEQRQMLAMDFKIKELQEKLVLQEEQGRKDKKEIEKLSAELANLKELEVKKVLEEKSRHILSLPADFSSYVDLADKYYDKKKHPEALVCYELSIEKEAKRSMAHTGKGNALFQLGAYEEAFKSYVEALKADQDYADAHKGKGDVLCKQGKYTKAIECYGIVLERYKIDLEVSKVGRNGGGIVSIEGKIKEVEGLEKEAREAEEQAKLKSPARVPSTTFTFHKDQPQPRTDQTLPTDKTSQEMKTGDLLAKGNGVNTSAAVNASVKAKAEVITSKKEVGGDDNSQCCTNIKCTIM